MRDSAIPPGVASASAVRRAQLPRLCVLLGRAEREVRRSTAAALASLDLTPDEFFLLAACEGQALPGQTELTTAVSLSAAQTSTLLERLRQRDWLTPQRSHTDRRRQVWGLTDAGRTRLEEGWRALEPVLGELTDRLSAEAWEALGCSLHDLVTPFSGERRRSA